MNNYLDDLQKAAENGDSKSQFNLGCEYLRKDMKVAAKWFWEAASQSHPLAKFNLGLMYYRGEGVELNKWKASIYFRGASERGVFQAQLNLANMYRIGDGIEIDKSEALRLYHDAAEKGYSSAQYNLGLMFYDGEGMDAPDKKGAAYWFDLAAKRNHPEACYNLGCMYHTGDGIEPNKPKAVECYRTAAYYGDTEAQINLGVMHAENKEIPLDNREAYIWFLVAERNGRIDVEEKRKAFEEKLGLSESEVGGIQKEVDKRMDRIHRLKSRRVRFIELENYFITSERQSGEWAQ